MDNEQEYTYWCVEYISVEGNDRWTNARSPEGWNSYDVRNAIRMGGVGDDPAEIKNIYETTVHDPWDYSWDFSNEDKI